MRPTCIAISRWADLAQREPKMKRGPIASLRERFRHTVKAGGLMLALLAAALTTSAYAQDLAPRAYLLPPYTPTQLLSPGRLRRRLDFNNAVPITNATGTYSVPISSLYHSLNFFGRSANMWPRSPTEWAPSAAMWRTGAPSIVPDWWISARLSVNLMGGRAMDVPEYAKWKQKKILGASLKMMFPTGQYDPKKLINWGINRWAFKPEIGYSQRFGNWVVDGYAGVWFYTTNPCYYNIPVPCRRPRRPSAASKDT